VLAERDTMGVIPSHDNVGAPSFAASGKGWDERLSTYAFFVRTSTSRRRAALPRSARR